MVVFYPDKFKKKVLPKGFFNNDLLTKKNLTLKQNAMQALILATDGITKASIQSSVLKVVEIYKNKIDDFREDGLPKAEAKFLAINKEILLRQRIENLVVYSEVQKLKNENEGSYYRWLPSGAENPDPEHQLLYGKTFLVGEGDDQGNMPGERYGCQCGMEILNTKENS